MQSASFIPFYNQDKDKKEFFFIDRVSFEAIETKIREKHPEMPTTILTQHIVNNDAANLVPFLAYYGKFLTQLFYKQKTDSLDALKIDLYNAYNCSSPVPENIQSIIDEMIKDGAIVVNNSCRKLRSNEIHWALLHEIGHSKMPYNVPCITAASIVAFFTIAYFWKKICNKKPYKNIVTKIGSKCIAAAALSTLLFITARNLEERRADNWANKNSDIKTLQGGLSLLKHMQGHVQIDHRIHPYVKYLPFCIGQYFIDPIHPSIQSRINKIEREIESRK